MLYYLYQQVGDRKLKTQVITLRRHNTALARLEAVTKLQHAFNALDDLLQLSILPKPFSAFIRTISQKIAKQIIMMEGNR
jgi:hypothetical protein